MKYWVFDGKQAVGPYEVEELKRIPLFGAQTLICPEDAGSAEQWRPAQYYLIKPPRAKPEPQPAAQAPAPAAAAEPAVADKPARDSGKRLLAAALGVAALGAAAAAIIWFDQAKKIMNPTPAPRPPAARQAPPPAPSVPEAEKESAKQAAVDFVKNFPLQSSAAKYPPQPIDIFNLKKWRPAATLGELYERRSLLTLASSAHVSLQKQGHTLEQGDKEIRRNNERWEAYARNFFNENFKLGWSSESIAGPVYRVTAVSRAMRGAREDRRNFEADLDKKTIKPLDSDAWFDLDPKKCAQWGGKNIRLGEPADPADFSNAPTYSLKPAKLGRYATRPARPKPSDEEPPDAQPAKEEEKVSKTAPQDAPNATPVAAQAISTATPKSAAQPPSAPSGSAAEAKTNKKNVSDMNMDELEQYLKREPKAK